MFLLHLMFFCPIFSDIGQRAYVLMSYSARMRVIGNVLMDVSALNVSAVGAFAPHWGRRFVVAHGEAPVGRP